MQQNSPSEAFDLILDGLNNPLQLVVHCRAPRGQVRSDTGW